MKRTVIVACGFALLAYGSSAQAPGFSHWTGGQLKDLEKTLPQKAGAARSATAPLADLGTHLFQLMYRDASGQGEVHEQMTDVFIVQAGEATLVVGGKLVDGKTTAPGELRGASLAGAQNRPLGQGDVVNIPAGTPHQLLIKDGKSLTYLVLKIRSRPGA